MLRSPDQGRTWKAISPDLTRNDKSKQQPSGGPITLDITSVEYYDTVFALAESPPQQGLLWAGTDDGLIHVDPQRRPDLGRCHAEGPAGVEHGQPHRTFAARCGDGLRRHRPSQAR